MKSIKELEQKIEKAIIETLSNYHQIKEVLENADYTPERKIKDALFHINQLRTKRFNNFPIDAEYEADELDLYSEYEADTLEELKLIILHRIMNVSSSPIE